MGTTASTTHPLCCHSCAPFIEHARRHQAEEIPEWIESEAWARRLNKGRKGMTVHEALEKMGWENPFVRGTATLKLEE